MPKILLNEAIKDNMTLSEYVKARNIFFNLKSIEKEELFAIALLCWVGVAEDKRMERTRRKGGAAV